MSSMIISGTLYGGVFMKSKFSKKIVFGLSLISTLMIYPYLTAGEPSMQFNEPSKPMAFEEGKNYLAVIHHLQRRHYLRTQLERGAFICDEFCSIGRRRLLQRLDFPSRRS